MKHRNVSVVFELFDSVKKHGGFSCRLILTNFVNVSIFEGERTNEYLHVKTFALSFAKRFLRLKQTES